MQLLTPKEVANKLGVTRRQLMERVKNQPDFPKPVKLSAKTYRWLETEIDSYIVRRKQP